MARISRRFEQQEFVKLLQKECTATLEATNRAGIPGGFSSYVEYDEFVNRHASTLMMCQSNLLRIYTQECNRGLNSFEKQDMLHYEQLVEKTCRELGITCTINTDPRGTILLLHLPSGKTNDFAGIGYCVP